ncbi:hypothetical protein PSGK_04040 [Pseudomonas solani]|uniref:hypothetical protein n=1 Tax=Pseudomonas solani TaxID=2731552 RepID=UPI0035BE945D
MSLALWQAHLALTLFVFLLLTRNGNRPGWKLAILALGLGLGWLPVQGMPLALFIRSFTDDLSLASLVLLGWLAAQRLGLAPLDDRGRGKALLLFAALALALYPAPLGLSYVDPYRLGFEPRPLLLASGLAALALLYRRNPLGVAMLVLPTLGFTLDLKASGNYWDYLIDPLLGLYCCAWALQALIRRVLRALRRPRAPFPPTTEADL